MSIAIFPFAPDLEGYEFEDDRDTLVVPLGRGQHEQRASRASKKMRRFTWPMTCTPEERERVETFLVARGYQSESFLILDPYDQVRFRVALGTSIASQVNFYVFASVAAQGGDYPVNEAASVLLDDGSVISATVDTDNQRFVAGAAPTASSVMLASYRFYKRVKLAGSVPWTPLGAGAAFRTVLALQEVPA